MAEVIKWMGATLLMIMWAFVEILWAASGFISI